MTRSRLRPGPGPGLRPRSRPRPSADAFGRATLVAALLAALGFVNEAARTSPLIRRCGAALIAQPSQRRYLIMTLGAHLFALVLGIGVLTLLGGMVMRSNTAAAAQGDAALVRQRLTGARQARVGSSLKERRAGTRAWRC